MKRPLLALLALAVSAGAGLAQQLEPLGLVLGDRQVVVGDALVVGRAARLLVVGNDRGHLRIEPADFARYLKTDKGMP